MLKLSLDILFYTQLKKMYQHSSSFLEPLSSLVLLRYFPHSLRHSSALAFHLPSLLILSLLLPLSFLFMLLLLFPPLSQIISPARSSFYCQGVSFFLQKCLIPVVLTGLPIVSGQEELKDGALDCRGRLPRVKLCSRRSRMNNNKSEEGITYRHATLGTCLLLERP